MKKRRRSDGKNEDSDKGKKAVNINTTYTYALEGLEVLS